VKTSVSAVLMVNHGDVLPQCTAGEHQLQGHIGTISRPSNNLHSAVHWLM